MSCWISELAVTLAVAAGEACMHGGGCARSMQTRMERQLVCFAAPSPGRHSCAARTSRCSCLVSVVHHCSTACASWALAWWPAPASSASPSRCWTCSAWSASSVAVILGPPPSLASAEVWWRSRVARSSAVPAIFCCQGCRRGWGWLNTCPSCSSLWNNQDCLRLPLLQPVSSHWVC